MRLEEDWREADATSVSQRASVSDLALIEELRSEEADAAMELENSDRRFKAVQADLERHQRLLPLITAADDAQDAEIELWQRQNSSSSDEESGSERDRLEGKYDGDAAEDDSAYSDDSAESSRQLSTTSSESASSKETKIKRKLVVRTRAMKKAQQEESDRPTSGTAAPPQTQQQTTDQTADDANGSETSTSGAIEGLLASQQKSCKRPAPIAVEAHHAARKVASGTHSLGGEIGVSSRLPAFQQPCAAPLIPLLPKLPTSPPARSLTLPHAAQSSAPSVSCRVPVLTTPPAMPPQKLLPRDGRDSIDPLQGAITATATSNQLEQVTLAEHKANEQQILLSLAKAIRREGRSVHEQQLRKQMEEQAARKQREVAEQETMAKWLQRATLELKDLKRNRNSKRRRVMADPCAASDATSLVKAETGDEQRTEHHDSDEDSCTDAATLPQNNKHPNKVRSPPSHRRGGRYSQLPGMATASTKPQQPTVRRDTNKSKGRQKKRTKKRKEEDEEWVEERQAERHAREQADEDRFHQSPPVTFFPLRVPAPDIRCSPSTTSRQSSSYSVASSTSASTASVTSHDSSSSAATQCAGRSAVESRDEQAKRERTRALSHFSFLGR